MTNMIHPYISYQNGSLHIDGVSLADIATEHGTPAYVYSARAILERYQAYEAGFADIDHQICFAVKANSNIAVLQLLARAGAGFDVVSGGELQRVLVAGGRGDKTVFSGLGKSVADIQLALNNDIACFNIESRAELDRINQVAHAMNKKAPVSLRVNPNVDAKSHPYISTGLKENKFGIAAEEVIEVYRYADSLPYLDVVGIDCHIGSQLTEIDPFVAALDKLIDMIATLKDKGIHLRHIDLGGGLGVNYTDETPPKLDEFAQALLPRLTQLGLKLYLEPGRSIIANAGVLLTQVDILKPSPHKNFAIVDAAMNDLIRPSLYQAVMDIVPVQQSSKATQTDEGMRWDVVGSICETSDFLGKDRVFTKLKEGDLLAVLGAGAYGFVMASNYNTRPRACEILVDQGKSYLIREREQLNDLWASENLLPF